MARKCVEHDEWRAGLASGVSARASEPVDQEQAGLVLLERLDLDRLLPHDGDPGVEVRPEHTMLRARVIIQVPENGVRHGSRHDSDPAAWHLVPGATVKNPAPGLGANAAPLLEEESHVRVEAPVP
jgi:hypothetical protein